MNLMGLIKPEPWMAGAVCAQTDPDDFFPDKGGATSAAKRVCKVCPVIAECLEYAMQHGEHFGVWGGLSERERRRLKRTGSTRRNARRPNGHGWACQCDWCHQIRRAS